MHLTVAPPAAARRLQRANQQQRIAARAAREARTRVRAAITPTSAEQNRLGQRQRLAASPIAAADSTIRTLRFDTPSLPNFSSIMEDLRADTGRPAAQPHSRLPPRAARLAPPGSPRAAPCPGRRAHAHYSSVRSAYQRSAYHHLRCAAQQPASRRRPALRVLK